MLPVPLAIGWFIWRQHRWGLLLALGYVLTAATASAVLPGHFAPQFGGPIAFLLSMSLMWLAFYLMGVVSFGFEADISARQSCFPPSLFTLPVRSGALAGWPLAYGAAAIGLLWLVLAGLILRPWLAALDLVAPLWWPAMLAMATLAWLQALLWSSFGLPVVRVIATIGVMAAVVAAVQISVLSNASEGFLVGLFGGVAAIAWLVAYAGVRKARCGDIPNWEGVFRRSTRLPRTQRRFASPMRTQVWFEWRRTGKALPLMTVLVLPFVLVPLLLGKNNVIPTARTLLGVLTVPVLLAGIAGTTVGGRNPWVKDYYGVAPFTATLPMTTAAMVAAKLKAAAMSALATWMLLAITVPLAVVLTGNAEEVAGWWGQAASHHHPGKIVAGITAAAILLVVWTWRRVVDSLLLGLTGRKWLIQGAVVGFMLGFIVLCAMGAWIYRHPETHETFLAMLPWLLGLLVVCRLLAVGWALRRVLRQGLVTPRTALYWLAAWLLLAAILFGLLAWAIPAEWVPLYYLAFAVVSVFPMARLAAAPVALAWNRHR